MTGLYRRVMRLFDAHHRRRLHLALAGSVFIAFAEVAAVLCILPLMTLVTGERSGVTERLRGLLGEPDDARLASYLALIVLAGFLVKGVSALAIRWWTLGFVNEQAARTARTLLASYLRAPLSFHAARGSADLIRTANDAVSATYSQVVSGGIVVATEAITVAAMAGMLLAVAPVASLVVGVYFLGVAVVLNRVVRRRARAAGADIIDAYHRAIRVALQSLGAIKEIKLRNEEQLFADAYGAARLDGARAGRMSGFLAELPKHVLELAFVVGVALMTALVYRDGAGAEALGLLALIAAAGFRIMPSSVRLVASSTLVRGGLAALDLVERDLAAARALPPTGPDDAGSAGEVSLDEEVALDGVTFRYADADTPVLHDVRLRVRAGSSLALVGSSGAGKSTLVDVLLGLLPPTHGRVLADGVDVADRLRSWQRHLAMVPQDVFLLDASVRDNVVFSPGESADDDRVWACLEQANLASLVRAHPRGLDMETGEHGRRLSGGQRQRVGIARALYRSPRLLVLDEATSALDNETEREISRTIDGLKGRVTTVVVAHRLSTVRHCDLVVLVQHGRVAGAGSFEELQASNADFARLVRLGSLEAEPA